MITIRKIQTLKPRVRVRKCGALMHLVFLGEAEEADREYIESLLGILLESDIPSSEDKEYFKAAFSRYLSGEKLAAEDIYYRVLKVLGEEVADWDFVSDDGLLDASRRKELGLRLLLDRVRSPYNIGAIFRSAESFGVSHIYLRECGDIESPRCSRTARGAEKVVPYTIIKNLSEVEGPFFALETGGDSLPDFTFLENAVCIVGSEESGVSPDALALCSSRVSIPMYGAKGSINVSVATGILLYSWSSAVLGRGN